MPTKRRTPGTLRPSRLSLFAIAMLAAIGVLLKTAPTLRAAARRCTLIPGSTLALVRVETDTTLPFGAVDMGVNSSSSVRAGPYDSLLATPSTLMPAARVRLLQLDSNTRATLANYLITDREPVAFIRAAPYRADCRTVRWMDTIPFAVRGEVGFVRATLAPRERWINGVPVLAITDVWNYPYPARRSLAYGAAPDAPLTSAAAMFSLSAALEVPRAVDAATRLAADSAKRRRGFAWALANQASAELEPARSLVRQAVLAPDWEVAERIPSRLRGTYRVDLERGAERSTWFFRTHDRPGYPWRGGDSLQTTAAMLASPHVAGYQIVGYAAHSRDSLLRTSPSGYRGALVWLATTDRPTAPDNGARRVLSGILEFNLAAASETFWNDLEPFAPRMNVIDSAMFARMNIPMSRGDRQPKIPLTIRLDERGGVRGDTTLVVGRTTLRVTLQRIDTLSMKRPF